MTARFGEQSRHRSVTPGFGRLGGFFGAAALILVLATLAWSAANSTATPSRHPRLFGGSLVLEDAKAPTVIDLATGSVTVRLPNLNTAVGTPTTPSSDIQAIPVTAGTMLVNRTTGAFNLLGHDDYVVDTVGGGVGLGNLPGATGATGYADGSAVYIVRDARHSTVSLVDESTVLAGFASAKSGSSRSVVPRGFAALNGQVSTTAGMAVVAGGDLWALVSPGAGSRSCGVVQLHPVPAGHNGLIASTRRALPVACGSAVLEQAGGVVAALYPGHAVEWRASGAVRDVPVAATQGATDMLPVGNLSGSFWFLAQQQGQWLVAGMRPGKPALAFAPIPSWTSSASPLPPVYAGGALYTIGRDNHLLSAIDPNTGVIRSYGSYPTKKSEPAPSFDNAEVIGVGPRVVFNNPLSLEALVVFTDGSHRPLPVDKSGNVGVDVSALGPGVVAPTSREPRSPAAPSPASAPAAVSAAVNCAKTNQTPYPPQISVISPSADSAVINWNYQLLDSQDCQPDTWSVRVTALGSAPQPSQPVRVVTGQQQLIFTGLRPADSYQAVVTAYINKQSTPSQPVDFTTIARGPDAPVSVHTTADGNGNWVVSWQPCSAANCFVPADSWTVIGSGCGPGYVGTPPSVQVPGNRTSTTISAEAIGKLGASLHFSVEGVTAAGLAGNPTSDGACTQAWAQPNPADMTLTAAGTQSGSTITATLQVSLAAGVDPSAAYGSDGAQFTYSVGGQTVGPTSRSRVTVTGLVPGTMYTPTVSVAPAGHPGAAVTLTGRPFSQNVAWPALSLSVPDTPDANLDTGPVTATIGNLPAGAFLATNIVLRCGSTLAIPNTPVATGGRVTFPVPLDHIGGTCTTSLTVVSTATPNQYGVASPTLISGSFALGTPASPSFSMTATCQLSCPLPVTYTLTGTNLPPPGARLAFTPSANCSVSGSGSPWTVTCNDDRSPEVFATWSYLGVTPAAPPPCAADCVAVGLTGPPPPPPTTTTTTTSPPPPSSVPCSTSSTDVPAPSTTTCSGTISSTTAEVRGSSGPLLAGVLVAGSLGVMIKARRRAKAVRK